MLNRGKPKGTCGRLGQTTRWGLVGMLIFLGVATGRGEDLRNGITTVQVLTIDQSLTGPGTLGAFINDCCRFAAQTFTAGLTGTLAGISIDVQSTSTFPLHVAIRTVTNGAPSTTVLGETTLTSSSVSLSQLITFPQVIEIVAGVQYAIVVNYEGAPPPAPGQAQGVWGGEEGDQYTGAARYFSFLDGTSWVGEGDGDLHFRTHVALELCMIWSHLTRRKSFCLQSASSTLVRLDGWHCTLTNPLRPGRGIPNCWAAPAVAAQSGWAARPGTTTRIR